MENKQYQDLAMKAQYMREQQDKKFEHELQVCLNCLQDAFGRNELYSDLKLVYLL